MVNGRKTIGRYGRGRRTGGAGYAGGAAGRTDGAGRISPSRPLTGQLLFVYVELPYQIRLVSAARRDIDDARIDGMRGNGCKALVKQYLEPPVRMEKKADVCREGTVGVVGHGDGVERTTAVDDDSTSGNGHFTCATVSVHAGMARRRSWKTDRQDDCDDFQTTRLPPSYSASLRFAVPCIEPKVPQGGVMSVTAVVACGAASANLISTAAAAPARKR